MSIVFTLAEHIEQNSFLLNSATRYVLFFHSTPQSVADPGFLDRERQFG